MQYRRYLQKVENIINDAIKGAFPRSWVEDTISYNICSEFQKQLHSETIEGLSHPFNVRWDSFKLRGKPENLYGDIAILVNYETWEGEIIKGIAFFEAKRKDKSKEHYPSLDSVQLIRQASNLKHSHLLLYSQTAITEFEDNLIFQPFLKGKHSKYHTTCTHALSIQTETAIQTNKNDRALYKFGVPFSHQICSRILRGMDLETDPKIINAVIGWAEDNIGGASYLLIASGAENKEPRDPQQLEINLKNYEQIGNDTQDPTSLFRHDW